MYIYVFLKTELIKMSLALLFLAPNVRHKRKHTHTHTIIYIHTYIHTHRYV